ncbi:MAG: response regulator transcription factor [Lawsonibacter sp.]|nr:response regulator transcription factor [Lawsonibacter sp.]
MKERILAVDDDSSILELISDVLSEQGMSVRTVPSGEEALAVLGQESFDLVLLDIMMKGISGLEVCRRIRDRVSCPIVFLSAKDNVKDVVRGLGLGADDYLTKPFALEELVARVQAHLRAQARVCVPPKGEGRRPIQIGEIRLDPESRTVERNGEAVDLSTREFDLLAYLMIHAGKTLSREQVFRDVWETDYGDVGTVAINIKKLRTKIDPQWEYIKTIWGSGYRFVTKSGYDEQAGGAADER